MKNLCADCVHLVSNGMRVINNNILNTATMQLIPQTEIRQNYICGAYNTELFNRLARRCAKFTIKNNNNDKEESL